MKSVIGRQIKLVWVVAGALALSLAASCSNSATGLQESYQQAYGSDFSKDSSALRVSTKISVTAKVTKTTTSTSVAFSVYGTTLAQGTMFFTNGSSVSKSFTNTKTGTVSASKTGLWYCRAKLGTGDYWYFDKNGDYWYFDRSGSWKPSSTTATSRTTSGAQGGGAGDDAEVSVSTVIVTSADDQISVTFEDGTVSASSTSGLVSIDAVHRNGDYVELELSGDRDSGSFGNVNCTYYVLETADGAQWYFDNEGEPLPGGYGSGKDR